MITGRVVGGGRVVLWVVVVDRAVVGLVVCVVCVVGVDGGFVVVVEYVNVFVVIGGFLVIKDHQTVTKRVAEVYVIISDY